MRNLKKLLAVVVAICVLATMTIPALAAETKTDAQICEILGVLKGDGAGVTDTYLAKGTNRMQAAQLYLRLIGLEDEALAETSTDNFDDANLVYAGGQRILAYLKANPDLGWNGVGGNKFEPTAAASAQMIYKVMLEALGYKMGTDFDFQWADTISFAKEKGLSKIADVTSLTNGDLATALVEALKANVKGSDKTLLQKLIDDKIIDEAAAIKAGLKEATPAKLEVVGVKADSLVRVVVTFNQAIDKDSIDDGDFEVAGDSIKKDDVSLSDDKTVATLKVAKLENGDEVEITIDGVKAVGGAELKDYEGEFTALDKTQPTIKSIEFTGPEVAKITFSEPVDETNSTPDIQIDGGIYSASAIAGYNNKSEVEINLGTELDEGKHTFKIKGFEDFAGYSNLVENITVEYAKVKGAPAVTVKEATQTYVVLKFERPVTDFDLDDFYHTYSNWKPLEILNGEGKEYVNENDWTDEIRLVFTNSARKTPSTASGASDNDRPLPVGTAKIVVKDEAVKDRWDNKIDGDVILSAEITADLTKPTITKVTVESEKEIRVYFSESVKEADAEKEANYKIKDSKGEVIAATKWSVDYNKDDKYAKIEFKNELDKGKYTITAEAIADTSLAANTLDTVTIEFEIVDKTAKVDLKAAWVDVDQVLFVKFGDDMDATSVLDEDIYRINGKKPDDRFDKDGDVKLSMFTSKIVKMQFRNLTDAQKADIIGDTLTVGRVKDAAGNQISALSLSAVIAPETAPVVEEVKKIADNKFELKLDQEIKSIASGAIEVAANGDVDNTSGASYKFTNTDGKGVITITVPASHKSPGTEGMTTGLYTIKINDGKIKSVTGVPVAARNITPGAIEFKDGVAPEIVKDSKDSKVVYAYDSDNNGYIDHIIVKYSERLNVGTVSKYTYTVDGYKVVYVDVLDLTSMDVVRDQIDAGITTSTNGRYVVIEVEELDSKKYDSDIDATPEVTQVLAVEDLAGNKLEAQDGIDAVAANKAEESGRD